MRTSIELKAQVEIRSLVEMMVKDFIRHKQDQVMTLCKFMLLVTVSLVTQMERAYAKEEFTIGIIQHNVFVDMYQLTYEHAIIAELEHFPFLKAIIKDAQGSNSTQISQVRDMISRNVDAIILWPVNGKDIIPAAREAYLANIPVIVSNSNIHKSGYQYIRAYSGPNNRLEGTLAAEIMCDRLKQIGNSKNALVVEIKGLKGYTTTSERSEGFRTAFAQLCPSAKIIASDHGDWNQEKAKQVMKNFISKYPKIDAVYCGDDNMRIGALKAAKQLDVMEDMVFVGATNFAEGYLAMKSGDYWGSIYQSPVLDAKKAIETAVKVLKGEDIPFFNYFDTPKITQENIDEFTKPLF